MPDRKEFEERIRSEGLSTGRVTNEELMCKDCIYKFNDEKTFKNTSRCGAYTVKPSKVLLGKPCDRYKKEEG